MPDESACPLSEVSGMLLQCGQLIISVLSVFCLRHHPSVVLEIRVKMLHEGRQLAGHT